MDNKRFVKYLNKINACEEAVKLVKSHGGTSSECWNDCERGDWMAWLTAKTKGITRRQLVGALADCATLSLKCYEAKYPDDKRVRECINTCRRYAKGEATDEELKEAASAAYAAANAASYAASYAAYAAANAASYATSAAATSAANASNATYAAAYAANATAYAAYAAAAASSAARAARIKTLKRCANIFRKHFPDLLKG
jgi:hypothetical protein